MRLKKKVKYYPIHINLYTKLQADTTLNLDIMLKRKLLSDSSYKLRNYITNRYFEATGDKR